MHFYTKAEDYDVQCQAVDVCVAKGLVRIVVQMYNNYVS